MMLYVAGKIAGLDPVAVKEKFRHAREILERAGYEVLNPLDVSACGELNCNGYQRHLAGGSYSDTARKLYKHSWECYLKHDIVAFLALCSGVALLDDWYDSPGAQFEAHVAARVGLQVRPVQVWLERGRASVKVDAQIAAQYAKMPREIPAALIEEAPADPVVVAKTNLVQAFEDAHIRRGEN